MTPIITLLFAIALILALAGHRMETEDPKRHEYKRETPDMTHPDL